MVGEGWGARRVTSAGPRLPGAHARFQAQWRTRGAVDASAQAAARPNPGGYGYLGNAAGRAGPCARI